MRANRAAREAEAASAPVEKNTISIDNKFRRERQATASKQAYWKGKPRKA